MAQTQQIRMSLMFDVNSSKAKASLQDLQKSLNGLTSNIGKGELKLTSDVQEAYVAAEKLKRVLNESVNMNTGQFDLSKFQYQLKQSGMSVQSLSADFAKAGSQGVQAFNSLASAIANAEIPTRRMNKVLDQMVKSFKDTMRWQISSSVVHGLTGALQSAYGYAQDLNKSLNDIRIVTGYNEEYMAKFAKEANNAARALSSTTNEYAKAALIFYQQGTLTDNQIAERTAATIKMANVTGEAAKDISSYMTAIWNNFDDGTKSIEYYADAITALGAATASSSEEIATGMQEFAAIGKTVGLSYDYAASALATVVAATRQSEETVGTSFKTIFSRLQSLQLGETLEDETTLTKYTAALAKVGVDIKLGNGELKQMDDIIDELGNKWTQLNQEQKTALAYTVAGSRQYTNFISLMDNYETFKVNVDIAADAEGTLDEQQKIYAESWEAAANRVRAAAEGIFQDLIDDKFFIDLLNGAEKLLSMLDLFMDSIGGLPGVLSLVSSLMLKIFNSQVTQSVRDIGYGLSHFLGIAQAKAGKTKEEFTTEAQKLTKRMRVDTVGDPMLNAELDSMSYRIQLEQEYIALESTLTEHQKEQYKIQMSLLDVMREQKKEKLEAMEAAKDELSDAGIAVVKNASIMSQDEFMPAEKEAWTLEHMGKLSDASAAEAAAREKAQEAFDSVAAKEAQASAEREALEAARIKRDELQMKHAAASKAKGAGFGNTTTGQSGAEAEADKQLAREYQAAEKLVRALESQVAQVEVDLATAQGEARAAQGAFYEALTAKIEIADEAMPEFNPIKEAEVGETLKKYIAYSTGRNDMLEKGIVDMLDGLSTISREDMTPEEYEKRLSAIATELQDFSEDYYVELGENTQKVIDSIIEQLRTTWNENGVDISSADIDTFTDQIKNASTQDAAKYRTGTTGKDGRIDRQGTAADIRAAMAKEQGVVIDDDTFAEFEEGYKKYAKSVREVRRITDQELDGVKDAYGEIHKAPEKLFDFADRITGVAQAASNLSLAFNSVKGAWDAMSNPDLSGWERFMAVFTALSTVVGSVMSTMQLLSKFKAGENEKTAKETLITWLNTIAQKENAKARRDNAAAADQQGDEIAETTRAKQQEIVTDVVGEGVDQATDAGGDALKGAGKKAAQEGGEAALKNGGKGLAKGGESLGKAFAKALPKLGPIIGGVALIAAGVAVLATAITLTVKGYNAARDAAKKAAETAQHFSEVATEAQQKYNDTVETISSYKEALVGMEELTKGTEEWDKALLETNKTAFELINQFDELAGKYHFENGQVVFDEGALEEMQAAQLAEAQDAQAASMAANIAARKAQANSDKTDMARDLNSSGDTWKKLGNAAAATGVAAGSGALIGAGAGLIAGGGVFSWASTGIGAAIGAVAGLTTGVIMATQDLTSTVDELDAMDELVALYGKNPSAFENEAEFRKALASTSIDLNDEILIDSLMKNREELSKTVAALYANEQAVKAETQAMIAAANADNKNYTESKYSDYLAVFGQQEADKEGDDSKRARIEKQVKDKWKGKNEDFWEEYLKEMYGKDADQYRVKDLGGGNVTLQKKSEDGTWETQGEKNSLSEKAAEAALIEKKMADLSDKEIADFEKKAQKIENNLEKAGLSKNVIDQAGLAYADNRAIDLSTLTGAQLDNIDLKAITDRNLREAMRTAAANAEESWQKILANYSSHVIDELNKFDTAITSRGYDVTREQLDLYAEALQDFTQVAGPQAATVFNENLVKVMDENSEKAADIMNLVAEIDWSNPQIGLSKFTKGMDALGISINAYGWEVDGISATLGEMAINNGLITDSEYLVELFKQLNSLSGKLTLGGILDGYAKDALIDSGFADSDDFLDTYDGQYKYVGEKYKYTDKLAYDAAVAVAMAGEDTARKNELYTDFKERSKNVKNNDPKSLLRMLNGITDEEYRLFVGKSLGVDGPATREDAIKEISGARKAQRDVENWKGYTRTYSENYWNNQRTSAARKMATEYIEQNLDSHWFDDYSNAQQYTLAKEYYTESGKFDEWFNDQKKPGGILPFAIGAGQQGGESEEQYRQRVDDYFNRVIAVNENSEGAIDALTSDLLAASKDGYWSDDVFGGDLARRYQDYFINENGVLDPDGKLETLLSDYTDALANIDLEQQKSISDAAEYAELNNTLSEANGLFTNMYTIFTNAASDPSDIEGFKSEDERVDAFKGVIGGASSIGDLQALRDNEVFASLFEREDVQKTYDIAVKALKRMNAEERALLDSLEDEKNRREQINTNLEHTKNLYDKISSADLIANLTQQRTETELLIEQDKEILAGTKNQYRRQRRDLQNTIGKDVAKVITDDEGNILNYEEIRRAAGEKYGYHSQQYADIVKQLEKYKSTGQEITELNEKIAENTNWIQNYWVHVGEGITAYIDGINSSISSSAGVINHYKNVVGLVGEEVLGINSNMLDEIRAGTQASANAALNAQKQQYELIKTAREQAEAELEYASEEEYSTRLKALEDLQKQEEEAFNAMNESFSAALEQAASNFADKIADITKNFEKSMTGTYGTFEEMQERYSQLSTLDDQYLDDYKKLYELSKLSRDLDKSIASTNSVKGKQELGALQQKLVDMQAEGSQISEHDLEVAQKEYELTLAKIALEEAQNAKSQVRLQKMANGSWGYVYTQNEDSIAAAEQSYEDKVFALRDSNEKYIDQLGQQTLELEAEMMSKLNEIAGMTNLSEEQRQAEMEKTIDFYKQRLGFVTSEIDKTLAYNQEILGTAGEFSDTLLGIMYPDMDSASSIYEQTVAMIGDEESGLLGEMITASQGYADEIANIFDITGQTVGGFATKVAEDLEGITTALNDSIAALTSYTQLQTRSWDTTRLAGIDREGNEITRGQLYDTVRDYYKMYNQRSEDEAVADYETRINNALFAMTDSELARYWNEMVGLSHLGGTKGYDYIDIKKFDTGGYTGEWGPGGRLAMLHEKELVLNAADTQNLLHIMEIMDQVIKNIDLSASAAASSRIHSPGITSSSSTLQQQVTIHAEFPEATNRHEIEAAFDTLINRASQYANRNR